MTARQRIQASLPAPDQRQPPADLTGLKMQARGLARVVAAIKEVAP